MPSPLSNDQCAVEHIGMALMGPVIVYRYHTVSRLTQSTRIYCTILLVGQNGARSPSRNKIARTDPEISNTILFSTTHHFQFCQNWSISTYSYERRTDIADTVLPCTVAMSEVTLPTVSTCSLLTVI